MKRPDIDAMPVSDLSWVAVSFDRAGKAMS
jgi:hypothetical protein